VVTPDQRLLALGCRTLSKRDMIPNRKAGSIVQDHVSARVGHVLVWILCHLFVHEPLKATCFKKEKKVVRKVEWSEKCKSTRLAPLSFPHRGGSPVVVVVVVSFEEQRV